MKYRVVLEIDDGDHLNILAPEVNPETVEWILQRALIHIGRVLLVSMIRSPAGPRIVVPQIRNGNYRQGAP